MGKNAQRSEKIIKYPPEGTLVILKKNTPEQIIRLGVFYHDIQQMDRIKTDYPLFPYIRSRSVLIWSDEI